MSYAWTESSHHAIDSYWGKENVFYSHGVDEGTTSEGTTSEGTTSEGTTSGEGFAERAWQLLSAPD